MALTAEDVYFRHQTIATLDTVADSGLGFHENSHFVICDPAGQAAGVLAMGVYPNVGIMFAYACFSFRGKQHNLRLSRALGEDRWSTTTGPMTFEIKSPLEEYRFSLADNPSGISLELSFRATASPGLVPGHQPTQMQFNQFGLVNGWLSIDGIRLEVHDWRGENCRWWISGAGAVAGFAAPRPQSLAIGLWSPLDFGDFKIFLEHNELIGGHVEHHHAEVIYEDGCRRVNAPQLAYELAFKPDTSLLQTGTITLGLENGDTLSIRLTNPKGVVSLLGAGLGQDPNYRNGQFRGEQYVAHETWDFEAEPLNAAQSRFVDHFLDAECDGKQGYGTFELILPQTPPARLRSKEGVTR